MLPMYSTFAAIDIKYSKTMAAIRNILYVIYNSPFRVITTASFVILLILF